jgi:aspartate racemase
MSDRATLELLSELRRLDVQIWAEGDRLRFSAPPGVMSPDLRARLSARKAELLAVLRASQAADAQLPLHAAPPAEDVPASLAQQRLWFLDRLLRGSPAYVVPFALRLRGALDIPALERALAEIVRRHQALRTTFAERAGQPIQVVAEALPVALAIDDLRGLGQPERAARVAGLARDAALQPFDLAGGPLLRARLLRLGDDDQTLLLAVHHIAADGWSIALFTRELAELYAAFSAGQPSPLAELAIQYRDFAHWQRQWLRDGGGPALRDQLAYWRRQLGGELPLLQLPTDRPRPAAASYRGATHTIAISPEQAGALHALGRQHGATLFMTLLAAFKALLYRYTAQADLLVGTPVAGRGRSELEPLIGFFVNTLVLRTDMGGNPTFAELLGRVRQVAVEAYANQDVPFEELVRELQPARDLSHQPLFQVMFVLQNTPPLPERSGPIAIELVELAGETAKFDLSLLVEATPRGLSATFEYSTDLFEAATIARMAAHWQNLLLGAAAAPETRLLDLPLLGDAERKHILAAARGPSAAFPTHTRIHDLFEAQAARSPEATALVCAGRRLTYAELNRRANQLARYLRRRGVGPETRVAICLGQSIEMVVGALGVLKAGGAYVPLDPNAPAERLAAMERDAQPTVVLATAGTHRLYGRSIERPYSRPALVDLDAEAEAIAGEDGSNLGVDIVPDNLAYVIYTSGSTGAPKGVAVTHQNLVGSTCARLAAYGATESFLLLSAFWFDSSVAGMFWALCGGGRLVLPGEARRGDVAELADVIAAERISHTLCLPSFYALLLERRDAARLASLRTVIVAGEACPRELIERHYARLPHAALFNEYGPTEATVWSSAHQCRPDASYTSVPIGRPIANQQLYVLDAQMRPAPVGVPGELYIGGAGVARGYHGRPHLTAERFVPDPFLTTDERRTTTDIDLALPGDRRSVAGCRLYKTGDLARLLPDGRVEFLGRADQQVKIRGFRVELGEIEACLLRHPRVRQAAVLAREVAGEQRLVAYLVPTDGEDSSLGSALREFLRERLPDYMLPAAFVGLEALPLTPTGKLDRRALPAPRPAAIGRSDTYLAPRDETERRIAGIWEELLGARPIGISDNFFELGGHSLLAVRLIARIEEQLGARLPLAALFEDATVAHLAHLARQAQDARPPSALVAIQPGGHRAPFFCVHPAGGSVLCYAELARGLGAGQPFYGLQARGIDDGQPPQARIEDMAAGYVAAIRAAQPDGPYLLGGWSLGGVVAFEMARQLTAQGHAVALLALFDSLAPAAGTGDNPAQMARLLEEALTGQAGPSESGGEQLEPRLRELYKAHLEALRHYEPGAYSGRVLLLRARDEQAGADDPLLGWGALAQVEAVDLPGDHYTILSAPHVERLATALRDRIERASAQGGAQG